MSSLRILTNFFPCRKSLSLNQTNFATCVVRAASTVSTTATTTTAKNVDFKSDDGDKDDDNVDSFIPELLPEFEEQKEKEEKYQKYLQSKRNVSRFPTYSSENKHRIEMRNYKPDELNWYSKSYFLKNYAFYGEKSGVDAAIAWPNKNELKEIQNDEKYYDKQLTSKMRKYADRYVYEISKFNKRYTSTKELVEKVPKQIEEYYQRVHKKDLQIEEKQKRQRQILDKAREYYGFEMHQNDERVQRFFKEAEDEAKKMKKEKRKTDTDKKEKVTEKKTQEAEMVETKKEEVKKVAEAKDEDDDDDDDNNEKDGKNKNRKKK